MSGVEAADFPMIYTTDTLKIKLLGPFRLDHGTITLQSLKSFLLNAYVPGDRGM